MVGRPKQRYQVNFNTLPFRKTHGTLPRGVALWIFYFSDAPEDAWIPHKAGQIVPMTYLAAKDYATAEAVRRKVTAIQVDPNPL